MRVADVCIKIQIRLWRYRHHVASGREMHSAYEFELTDEPDVLEKIK